MGIKNVNNFTGGIGNSEYIGKPGSYVDSLNVDVYDGKGLQLGKGGNESFINSRLNGYVIGAVYSSSSVYRIYATYDGRIEIAFSSSDSFQFKSSIQNIFTKQIGNTVYGIILTNSDIYKWVLKPNDIDLGVGSNGANITLEGTLPNVDSIPSFFNEKCPYIINSDLIYVTGGNIYNNDIFTIDTTTSPWTITNTLKLDDGFTVTYMGLIGSSVHIVGYDGGGGKEVYWDGISNTLSSAKTYGNRFIGWYGKPIEGGATFQNSNYYVINKDLYLSQGYNSQRLYVGKDFKVGINNALETIGEHLYIPGNEKVYKYGQPIVGLPHNLSATRVDGSITYMEHNLNSLDVFYTDYTDGGKKKVISIYNTYYTLQYGTLYSYKFDGGQYGAKKNLIKCRIGYNIPIGTGADIYVKYDNNTKNATFYTDGLLSYTTPPSIGDVYNFNNIDYTITSVIRKTYSGGPTTQGLIINGVSTTPSNVNSYDYGLGFSLTKVSGNGEASYQIDKADYGFQLLKELDNTKTTDTIMIRDSMPVSDFNEIQVKIDMWTVYDNLTPTIYDYTLEYNIIENDFGG